ncbi:MAG: LuxR C-terminal-related transcriptional regulator [Chloroflexota bacterium]
MVFPLIQTKLFIPVAQPSAVARPHLLEQIQAGVQGKLTLVSAPAGYGKTSLVAAWAAQVDHPVAWVSLDPADNEPRRFLAYLIAAIQRGNPSIGVLADEVLRGAQTADPATIITLLLNDLTACEQQWVVVLDDYHLISTDAIHQAMELWLAHAPAHVHLMVLTRSDPPFRLPMLRVRQQLNEVRTPALQFSLGETQRLLGEIESATLDQLHTQTEGWVAALQLAAISFEQTTAPLQVSGRHRYVVDYLVDEVLNGLPDRTREFLFQTCFLQRFSSELCDAVTERTDSQLMLNELEQANLFLIPLDTERQWFRYHHLFAEFLQTRDEHLHTSRYQRAAHWCLEHEWYDEAMLYAQMAEDWEIARRILAQTYDSLMMHGQIATIQEWLSVFPEAFVVADYDLSVCQAWASFFRGDVTHAHHWLSVAISHNTNASLPGELISLQAFLTIDSGHLTSAYELVQHALACVPDDDQLRGILMLNLAQIEWNLGRLDAALLACEQGVHLCRQQHNLFGVANVLSTWQQLLMIAGQRTRLVQLAQQSLEWFAPHSVLHYAPLLGSGFAAYMHNDLVSARQSTVEAIRLSTLLGDQNSLMTESLLLAQIEMAEGMSTTAIQRINTLLEQVSYPLTHTFLTAIRAGFFLRVGNVHSATVWAQQTGFSVETVPHQAIVLELMTFVRVLLVQRQFDEALVLLDRLVTQARESGHMIALIGSYCLLARVHYALGDQQQATAMLHRAVQLAAPEQLVHVFLDEDVGLQTLLPFVRDTAPTFVDLLIEPVTDLREALTDREREILQLIATGLSNSEIAQRLVVSVGTVKTHSHHIYSKLGVRNRVEAVDRARQLNLLD